MKLYFYLSELVGKIFEIIKSMQGLLDNLDPSLFRNVILGILAIFVPFAIVFLTDVLNGKRKRSEFEKFVLNDEIFAITSFFLIAIFGIFVFSFLKGTDISNFVKIGSILGIIIFSWLLSKPFFKIQKFAKGEKVNFEIAFLKKLKFAKILRFLNKGKSKKMLVAWESFWSEETTYSEKEFTAIFISHIDEAIRYKYFDLAISLSQTYLQNIKERELTLCGSYILPKILEWSDKLIEEEQNWLNQHKLKDRISNALNWKVFTPIKKLNDKIFSILLVHQDCFWQWQFFHEDFLKKVVEILLLNQHYTPFLFRELNGHIEKCEKKLLAQKEKYEKTKKDEDKDKIDFYRNYFSSVISSFCSIFFEKILEIPNRYAIWRHERTYFPGKWKITNSNIHSPDNFVSHVFLEEYMRWACERIETYGYTEDDKDHDTELNEVTRGLFPNVSPIFATFLIAFFTPKSVNGEMKDVIEWNWNLYVINIRHTFGGDLSDEEIGQIFYERDKEERNEAIKLIFTIFGNDNFLTIVNLQKFQKELINLEKELKDNKCKETRRKALLGLIDDLIKAHPKK